MQDLRSSLSKAKGLGSSKSGLHHWLAQRITALILVLSVVYIFYIAHLVSGHSMSDIVLALQKPGIIIPMLIFTTVGFYHAALGMQVVIEDYVPNLAVRYTGILLVKIFSLVTVISTICALIYLMVL